MHELETLLGEISDSVISALSQSKWIEGVNKERVVEEISKDIEEIRSKVENKQFDEQLVQLVASVGNKLRSAEKMIREVAYDLDEEWIEFLLCLTEIIVRQSLPQDFLYKYFSAITEQVSEKR